MSVIEDLRMAEQQALKRLRELEPLAAEYEQLRKEVQRLGLTDGAPAAKTNASARATARGTSQPKRRRASARKKTPAAKPAAAKTTTTTKRAPAATRSAPRPGGDSKPARTPGGSRSSSRADDIARLVAQQPGITVTELARNFGVNATGLYRPVRRLVSEGKLRKDGTALHPADK